MCVYVYVCVKERAFVWKGEEERMSRAPRTVFAVFNTKDQHHHVRPKATMLAPESRSAAIKGMCWGIYRWPCLVAGLLRDAHLRAPKGHRD